MHIIRRIPSSLLVLIKTHHNLIQSSKQQLCFIRTDNKPTMLFSGLVFAEPNEYYKSYSFSVDGKDGYPVRSHCRLFNELRHSIHSDSQFALMRDLELV